MEYFRAERVSAHVQRIFGPANELMYLVEGSERCALLDSGCGLGNLYAFIKQLTKKPCIVLLTHGHVDHAMGAFGFEAVYISRADEGVYKANSAHARRMEYIHTMAKQDNWRMEDIQPACEFSCFNSMAEGDVFTLGGVELEVLPGRGHTPGMLTVLVVQDGLLLLGDALNYFTLLLDEFALDPRTLHGTLDKLVAQTNKRLNSVALSHPPGEAPVAILQSGIQLCEDILQGKVDDIPVERWGSKGVLAKKAEYSCVQGKRSIRRLDGGIANIVYSREKIGESIIDVPLQ